MKNSAVISMDISINISLNIFTNKLFFTTISLETFLSGIIKNNFFLKTL